MGLECNREIEKAIDETKFEKSPGQDGIINELVKIGKSELSYILQILFNKILEEERIPTQWEQSQIILFHKTGDRSNINNYRPISFTAVLGKIFTRLIQKRIKIDVEEYQTPKQAGFRKNKSTIQYLHAINQLAEKSTEYNIKIYI